MGLQTGRNKVFALHRPIQSPSKRSHRPSWGVPDACKGNEKWQMGSRLMVMVERTGALLAPLPLGQT